ncbi:MAG: cell division protein FtsQ/DivIB [Actinomycetales bacterium]
MSGTRVPAPRPLPTADRERAGAVDARGRFAARARARRLLRLRPLLGCLAVVALLAGAAWLVLASPWLRVSTVAVSGTHRLDAAAVRTAAAVPAHEALARVDTGAIAQRVSQLAPVKHVEVTRSWPSTIRVTVTERTPIAVLRNGNSPLQLVDATGTPFAAVAAVPRGLPVVTLAFASQHADRRTTAAIAAAAHVAAGLPADLRAKVRTITAQSADDVRLALATTAESTAAVVWGDDTQLAQKSAVLRVLLATAPHATTYDVSAPDAPTTQQ